MAKTQEKSIYWHQEKLLFKMEPAMQRKNQLSHPLAPASSSLAEPNQNPCPQPPKTQGRVQKGGIG